MYLQLYLDNDLVQSGYALFQHPDFRLPGYWIRILLWFRIQSTTRSRGCAHYTVWNTDVIEYGHHSYQKLKLYNACCIIFKYQTYFVLYHIFTVVSPRDKARTDIVPPRVGRLSLPLSSSYRALWTYEDDSPVHHEQAVLQDHTWSGPHEIPDTRWFSPIYYKPTRAKSFSCWITAHPQVFKK